MSSDLLSNDFPYTHRSLLVKCAGFALIAEIALIIGLGLQENRPKTSAPLNTSEDRFVEAQIVQLPQQPKLIEEQPSSSSPQAVSRIAINPAVPRHQDTPSPPTQKEESNETQAGPKPTPNHGPVAVFAPSPVIPHYLQAQEFKTSVLIDFYVSATGHATPRLVGSSGNEELDAIAIETAKKWQFKPAEQDGQPIDQKVRLRIVFEVS